MLLGGLDTTLQARHDGRIGAKKHLIRRGRGFGLVNMRKYERRRGLGFVSELGWVSLFVFVN